LIGLFKKKDRLPFVNPLKTDLHSHLLPGIDDGSKSWDESIEILKLFARLGFEKVITTPHINMDFYPNKEADLKELGKKLKEKVDQAGINLKIEVAAEYYLDENLFGRIENNPDLLLISNKYLLFETPFFNKPVNLTEFVFKVNSSGLLPLLAHPERYIYLSSDIDLVEELISMGTLFQLNINSLGGYYGPEVKKFADKLVSKGNIHLVGSDCHRLEQLKYLEKVMRSKSFRKVIDLPLQNSQL